MNKKKTYFTAHQNTGDKENFLNIYTKEGGTGTPKGLKMKTPFRDKTGNWKAAEWGGSDLCPGIVPPATIQWVGDRDVLEHSVYQILWHDSSWRPTQQPSSSVLANKRWLYSSIKWSSVLQEGGASAPGRRILPRNQLWRFRSLCYGLRCELKLAKRFWEKDFLAFKKRLSRENRSFFASGYRLHMTLETWQAPRSWSMRPNPHTEAQRVERLKESMFEA